MKLVEKADAHEIPTAPGTLQSPRITAVYPKSFLNQVAAANVAATEALLSERAPLLQDEALAGLALVSATLVWVIKFDDQLVLTNLSGGFKLPILCSTPCIVTPCIVFVSMSLVLSTSGVRAVLERC